MLILLRKLGLAKTNKVSTTVIVSPSLPTSPALLPSGKEKYLPPVEDRRQTGERQYMLLLMNAPLQSLTSQHMNCATCLRCGVEVFLFCCQKQGLITGYCSHCLPYLDPAAIHCPLCDKSICRDIQHLQKRSPPLPVVRQPLIANEQPRLQDARIDPRPQDAFKKDRQSKGQRPLANPIEQEKREQRSRDSQNQHPSSSQRSSFGRAGRRENSSGFGFVEVPREEIVWFDEMDFPVDYDAELQRQRIKNGVTLSNCNRETSSSRPSTTSTFSDLSGGLTRLNKKWVQEYDY